MQIDRKDCGKNIPADNINLNTMLAKCSACNSIFNLQKDYEMGIFSKKKIFSEPLPLPRGISIQKDGLQLLIKRRWFSLSNLFLTVFVIIWDTFVVFWMTGVISSSSWLIALFGSFTRWSWCLALTKYLPIT
ncbi:MAG: hypothetical protein H7A23_07270 [Leptospiraceae bacterium]|nr:hypothetical protein [Leptospiraceae bacterium]MCP5494340.1 hypothetical protein [Leptospiraceae bacterium]